MKMKQVEYEKKVLAFEQQLLSRWIAIRRYGLLLGDKWRLRANAKVPFISPTKIKRDED